MTESHDTHDPEKPRRQDSHNINRRFERSGDRTRRYPGDDLGDLDGHDDRDDNTIRQDDDDNIPIQREQPLYRNWFRALVQDFTPLWFTWCMNAGIISILLHQEPYQFSGEKVLATIGYVVLLVFFVIFSVLFITRLIWFRGEAYREITRDTSELALVACWPISFLVLSALTSLIVSTSYWGHHAFTLVGYVMWWIGAMWMICQLLGTFSLLIYRGQQHWRQLPPTIMIPAVGVTTVATTGGLISSFSYNISAGLAVPVIIFSYMCVGIGLIMALFLYTLLFLQLLLNGWPSGKEIPVIFVLVGPMGQSAAALQVLASAADTYHMFGMYHKGTFLTEMAAPVLSVACALIALLLTGMGIIWLFLAIFAFLEKAYHRDLRWSPVWNSIIFPTGTLATSFLELSIVMDSPTFRVLTTILLISMVVFFFLNLAFTMWEVAFGDLLIVRKNPRVSLEHKLEDEA